MNCYKDYTQKARKLGLVEPHIILCGDVTPKLNHYIKILDDLHINEGSYQEYYGEVKKIVNSFIIHWTEVMNKAIKEADKVTKLVNREELIDSVQKTIGLQKIKQIFFEKSFLPVTCSEEKVAYDEILMRNDNHLEGLKNLEHVINQMRDHKSIEEFSKDHFSKSLRSKNDIFRFTHTYIAVMLLRNINKIRISLEEIAHRVRNNLQQLEEKRGEELNCLLNQLYNKNKEQLAVSRKPWRDSSQIAEVRIVQKCLDKLKCRIECHKEGVLARVKEEADYWNEKLKEFNQIDKTVKDLNEIEQKIREQQQTYLSLRDTEIPPTKRRCWEHMEKMFNTKLERLEEKKKEAGRALISFFSVRGPDHIFYNDSIGRYYVDEYGHKVYCYDYGLNMYHVNCNGEFFEAHDTEAYYYDVNGRYVLDANGDKTYKIAPCTSSYRMVNDLLKKCTVDCGHSEQQNKSCKMDIRHCGDNINVPKTKMQNIKGTLSKETALYLWDSFGHILPEVLYQVATEQPKNPIHCLAHKLIRYKYSRTLTEMEQKRAEAAKYRENIYQERKDKAVAASKEWKSKQVKRRKPEESDEVEVQAAYGAHLACQEFINFLPNFYG
ncbi:PREDICTED: uncharacterized protein LOC106110477 isoform X1 [Papilio polytes]|uniref:uncharacterized protein LOC106110477 isoform X1 n=1 Tax=Papilio polytes TaxID=76194 RepID=UPI0006768D94|nr:PREDICTED: uncharacterized protein LOC106110477 isoform X1 [Papilio polytes]